jgi:membrane protein implicated in regulation of membrane protease activity
MARSWLWAIAGLLLIGAEAVLPGFYLLWIGIAALATWGITAVLPVSLEVQLALFAITTLLSCVIGWLIYRRTWRARDAPRINDPTARMVGSVGRVSEAIRDGQGKVRIGDSDWLAEGPDLPSGAAVRVRGLAGTALKVEALSEPAAR